MHETSAGISIGLTDVLPRRVAPRIVAGVQSSLLMRPLFIGFFVLPALLASVRSVTEDSTRQGSVRVSDILVVSLCLVVGASWFYWVATRARQAHTFVALLREGILTQARFVETKPAKARSFQASTGNDLVYHVDARVSGRLCSATIVRQEQTALEGGDEPALYDPAFTTGDRLDRVVLLDDMPFEPRTNDDGTVRIGSTLYMVAISFIAAMLFFYDVLMAFGIGYAVVVAF
jgi:hypothetical protein